METVKEFFERIKVDSLENLNVNLDSFLANFENKNDIIKELIKLYRNEKKELEKVAHHSSKDEYNIQLYMQIRKIKKSIKFLTLKVECQQNKKNVDRIKKNETPSYKIETVQPKRMKKKEKAKFSFSEETLTLANKVEQGENISEIDTDQISNLIKYYRHNKEKLINLKIGYKNKDNYSNLELINAQLKQFDNILRQLTDLKRERKKTIEPIKKSVNKAFKIPISLKQMSELDRYFDINTLDLINSLEDSNNLDNIKKIECIYVIYLECKEKALKNRQHLISTKRNLQKKENEANNELLEEVVNTLEECNTYINLLNNLINYLKTYYRNKLKKDIIDHKKSTDETVYTELQQLETDEVPNMYQELLEYMELGLDISSNNIKNIIEAYKLFIKKADFNAKWDYIVKLSNFILQKMEKLPPTEFKYYKNMINDCLKYKKLSISKENADEKYKVRVLQNIWKTSFNDKNEIKIDIFSDNAQMQITNIMTQSKLSKEEANIVWLNQIEEMIIKSTKEQLEIIINILSNAKDTIREESFQEKLTSFLNQYSYIFENYFDLYIMDMSIPKDKQNVLKNLKNLLQNQELKIQSNNSYGLFYEVIFKEKSLSSLKKLLSMDPKFINIKSYDDTYLLENILDLLINQIINEKYYYLENVFSIFLKYAGIYMSKELHNNLVRKINDIKEEYKEQYNLDCILSNLHNKLDNIVLLDDVKILQEEVYTHKKRKTSYKMFNNLLNRTIITIDQQDTKYFENAISCDMLKDGTYQVGIYVSDVVDCLNEDLIINSNILSHKEFKTPVNRYNKHILKQGKVKFALAFEFILDEELNIINFNVERARIRVKKNYTYDDVTKILNDGDTEDKMFYVLQRMNNMARIMYRKRNPKKHLKKYMEFVPEIQREFTFFVNRYIAKDATNNDLPLIYKNQLPKESINLFDYLENSCTSIERVEKITGIILSSKTSSYSTINRGNCYFNGEEYTQVTSPTRELISLLNQILIINNYIDNEYIDIDQKNGLEKTLMLINHFNSKRN